MSAFWERIGTADRADGTSWAIYKANAKKAYFKARLADGIAPTCTEGGYFNLAAMLDFLGLVMRPDAAPAAQVARPLLRFSIISTDARQRVLVAHVALYRQNGALAWRVDGPDGDVDEALPVPKTVATAKREAVIHYGAMPNAWRMVCTWSGVPMSDGRPDGRYTIGREYTGRARPCFVARFCGEWIGRADTNAGAWLLAINHDDTRQRALRGEVD